MDTKSETTKRIETELKLRARQAILGSLNMLLAKVDRVEISFGRLREVLAEYIVENQMEYLHTHLHQEVLKGKIEELSKLMNDLSGNKVRISIVDLMGKIQDLERQIKENNNA